MGIFDIFKIGKIKKENETLKQKLQELHADEYYEIQSVLNTMNQEIQNNNATLLKLREENAHLTNTNEKLAKQATTVKNKISRYKDIYNSIEYSLGNFLSLEVPYNACRLSFLRQKRIRIYFSFCYFKTPLYGYKRLAKSLSRERKTNQHI